MELTLVDSNFFSFSCFSVLLCLALSFCGSSCLLAYPSAFHSSFFSSIFTLHFFRLIGHLSHPLSLLEFIGSLHLPVSSVSKQSICCLTAARVSQLEKKKLDRDCILFLKNIPLYTLISFCILIICWNLQLSFVIRNWT